MRKRGLIRTILFVIIVGIVGFLYYKNFQTEKEGLIVKKWENYNNENNKKLYYQDIGESKNEEIKKLIKTFKIDEIVSKEKTEIDKVNKTVQILNTIVDYDNVADLNLSSGYKILEKIGDRKKVSFKDMAIIERDLIVSAGFNARVGEFRKKNCQFESSPSYYVVEYYSLEQKKWIMIDFKNGVYIKDDKECFSSVELIDKGINENLIVGNVEAKEYVKEMNKYLYSYTIDIDNTINKKKSNTVITYLKDENQVELKKSTGYIEPTIYTESVDMFLREPGGEIKNKDSKAYLLFMKDVSEENRDKQNFVVAAFRDSSVIKEYYLKINNADFIKVDNIFYNIEIKGGENKIELSLDGKDIISTVVINNTIK